MTRNIQRYNAERRKVRQRSTGPQGIYGTLPLQPEVRAMAARIVALLEGDGHGIIRPTERALIDLLATALALTCLSQNQDPDVASRGLSVPGSRSPGAQDTG